MGNFGGFYKGEKKKLKKTKTKTVSINAPVFKMPEIISKNKKYS